MGKLKIARGMRRGLDDAQKFFRRKPWYPFAAGIISGDRRRLRNRSTKFRAPTAGERPRSTFMSDELDASFNESLTVAQRDALVARLRTAWNNLPPETQEQFKPVLDDAHKQLGNYIATGKPPSHDVHSVLRLKSYLTGDWDNHLAGMKQPLNNAVAQPLAEPIAPAAVEISVGAEGDIMGSGKYQTLDPRWELVVGIVLFENILHKHPFPTGTPPIHPIADTATFALVGDYGTGNFGSGDSPSTKISKFIPTLHPDYAIHLGDVYYAGTNPEETSKLLGCWPRGAKASFTLNSNHEMYSGAGPYFNMAIGSPIFNLLQSPWSFFALENTNWVIVGLDSAYYSSEVQLYMNGTLGANNNQTQFLRQVAALNKKTIILTHHNPIPLGGLDRVPQNGDEGFQLYTDVMSAFAGRSAPAYWYFGHKHNGVAYHPLAGSNLLCRCLGHGALPAGVASDLTGSTNVAWFEKCNAGDPDDNLRIYNGFLHLELNGPDLTEIFYDETGRVAWQPGAVDNRCP
jgi:hypothetical protein